MHRRGSAALARPAGPLPSGAAPRLPVAAIVPVRAVAIPTLVAGFVPVAVLIPVPVAIPVAVFVAIPVTVTVTIFIPIPIAVPVVVAIAILAAVAVPVFGPRTVRRRHGLCEGDRRGREHQRGGEQWGAHHRRVLRARGAVLCPDMSGETPRSGSRVPAYLQTGRILDFTSKWK